jgi:hypothetical protein
MRLDVVAREVATVGNGGQTRIYDLIVKDPLARLFGVDVKSNSATATGSQRAFDQWVNEPGNVAKTGPGSKLPNQNVVGSVKLSLKINF